jgi:heme-degrading monooxygenase HmoA
MSVVEVVHFRLAEGASEPTFLEQNRRAQAFVAERPGFVSREVARGDDGSWVAIVRWRSAADADASFAAFVAAPETQPFMALLDGPSMRAGRYTAV